MNQVCFFCFLFFLFSISLSAHAAKGKTLLYSDACDVAIGPSLDSEEALHAFLDARASNPKGIDAFLLAQALGRFEPSPAIEGQARQRIANLAHEFLSEFSSLGLPRDLSSDAAFEKATNHLIGVVREATHESVSKADFLKDHQEEILLAIQSLYLAKRWPEMDEFDLGAFYQYLVYLAARLYLFSDDPLVEHAMDRLMNRVEERLERLEIGQRVLAAFLSHEDAGLIEIEEEWTQSLFLKAEWTPGDVKAILSVFRDIAQDDAELLDALHPDLRRFLRDVESIDRLIARASSQEVTIAWHAAAATNAAVRLWLMLHDFSNLPKSAQLWTEKLKNADRTGFIHSFLKERP